MPTTLLEALISLFGGALQFGWRYPPVSLVRWSGGRRSAIWDSIAEETSASVQLAPEQRAELHRRLAAHRADPSSSVSSEVPRQQRALKTLAKYARESSSRNAAIKAAYASGAYSLKDIGDHFGLHYATISRIARQ